MATNFVVTGLADFTNANPQKALALVLLEGTGTKDHFDFVEGVKYQTKIPYTNNVAVDISTGAFQGYNTGSGTTTIVDVTLANKQLKIFETYTKEKLTKTILGGLEKKGTDPNELTVEAQLVALKGKSLALANEKLIWQADTSTTIQTEGSTLNSFDGILSQLVKFDGGTGIAGAYGYRRANFSGESDASCLLNVNKMYNAAINLNEAYSTMETVLAMSPVNFAQYSRAVYNLNGTVTTQTIGADGKPIEIVYIPGTQCKVVPMIGLSGKTDMVLTIPQNIIVVYDLVSEDEKLELIYNPFARQFELFAGYKLGVKVVDPSACVVTLRA
jgi:hypothetical protein